MFFMSRIRIEIILPHMCICKLSMPLTQRFCIDLATFIMSINISTSRQFPRVNVLSFKQVASSDCKNSASCYISMDLWLQDLVADSEGQ